MMKLGTKFVELGAVINMWDFVTTWAWDFVTVATQFVRAMI